MTTWAKASVQIEGANSSYPPYLNNHWIIQTHWPRSAVFMLHPWLVNWVQVCPQAKDRMLPGGRDRETHMLHVTVAHGIQFTTLRQRTGDSGQSTWILEGKMKLMIGIWGPSKSNFTWGNIFADDFEISSKCKTKWGCGMDLSHFIFGSVIMSSQHHVIWTLISY